MLEKPYLGASLKKQIRALLERLALAGRRERRELSVTIQDLRTERSALDEEAAALTHRIYEQRPPET